MTKTGDDNQRSHDDLPTDVAEQLVAYEEAKAEGNNGSTLASSVEPELRERLATSLSCVDLLHRVWPDDEQAATLGSEELKSKVLGDFRIIQEIGRGGMGVVYEAEQISLGRKVALKVLPYAAMLDSRRLQRFKNEAHAAATLHHHNIVNVFAIGSERSVHFYAMQFIEGQTLAQIIQDLQMLEQSGQSSHSGVASSASLAEELASGGLPEHEIDAPAAESTLARAATTTKGSRTTTTYYRSVAKLMEQACDALDYAHQHGVIHRDIKPSNLMLDADGRAWVTDFGLAQIECDVQITMTGDIVGTLRYMSPEQALARRVTIDHRTDIYSLGATLYELLTLQPVVVGEDRQQVMRSIAFDEPRKPRKMRPSVPRDLETIALKALSKSPDSRYQSARDMADDLSHYLNHEPIRAKRPSLAHRLVKWTRRHRWITGAVLLTATAWLIAAQVVAVYALRMRQVVEHRTSLLRADRNYARASLTLLHENMLQDEGGQLTNLPGGSSDIPSRVEELYQHALSARQELADANPNSFDTLLDIAVTRLRFSILLVQRGQHEAACHETIESLRILNLHHSPEDPAYMEAPTEFPREFSHMACDLLRIAGQTRAALRFARPLGMAIGKDDKLYVSSRALDSVLRFSLPDGSFLGELKLRNRILAPHGLAFGPDNVLYVCCDS
ncbi:MAG: protein kinase domain-containing protein, partial [Bythopirellula sp.]